MRVRGLKRLPGTGPTRNLFVAPHAGAWIETPKSAASNFTTFWSHPMRVRGLKHNRQPAEVILGPVAPHAGAWIETFLTISLSFLSLVAPHAGAWIETA